jgi:hypothetical protein
MIVSPSSSLSPKSILITGSLAPCSLRGLSIALLGALKLFCPILAYSSRRSRSLESIVVRSSSEREVAPALLALALLSILLS